MVCEGQLTAIKGLATGCEATRVRLENLIYFSIKSRRKIYILGTLFKEEEVVAKVDAWCKINER